jgi:hypothetical protein
MSDFLKKLKEAVETGKPNEAIKAGFEEILTKADKHAADPNAMKSLQEKYDKINEEEGMANQVKMTAEEVAELNKLAKAQEDKIMAFEQDLMVQSGLELINLEIAKKKEKIENLNKEIIAAEGDLVSYQSRLKVLLDTNIEYKEKKRLIDISIEEANA